MTTPSSRQRSGRRQFLVLAAIFFLPVAAAAWLYFSSGWKPASGAQHGLLIDPPRTLTDERLRGSWFLVYVTGDTCDQRCADALKETLRVRLALDKERSRVKRALLHPGDCCGANFPDIADVDLLLFGAEGPAGALLLSQFPPAADGRAGIYIVDPHGNLLMSYPATGTAQGLLKDLERLLRLSQIG